MKTEINTGQTEMDRLRARLRAIDGTKQGRRSQQRTATVADLKLQGAVVQWIKSIPKDFDVAACLHVPTSLREDEGGWDDIWLEKKLHYFFNRLDRQVLKSAHRRRKQRIPRFVVLETKPSVGWHAHVLLSSQGTGVGTEKLCMMAKLLWLEELGHYRHDWSAPRLAWAERSDGDYGAYLTKYLSASTRNEIARIDVENTQLG